ncbi:MAG: flavodoxin family protein [Anaerolineales bacterium]|nr:flavodoxin family protein [Anaerolineales bacterium]
MAEPKIVIIKGSPRKNGNSAVLADRVAEGAREAGARITSFYLHEMEINPCDACEGCRGGAYNGCIISDDMQEIYSALEDADAFVVASPVYWFTVSAQTKLFMDRCYAMVDADGYLLKGKKVGIVMTYGDDDPFASGAVNAFRTFQDAYKYVGAEIVGMVYGDADGPGEIKANEKVMEAAYKLGKKLASACN